VPSVDFDLGDMRHACHVADDHTLDVCLKIVSVRYEIEQLNASIEAWDEHITVDVRTSREVEYVASASG
jgi:hypothetical protein